MNRRALAFSSYYIWSTGFQSLMMAFFPLYFASVCGLTPLEIGVMSASENLATILASLFLAGVLLPVHATLLSLLVFLGIFFVKDFWLVLPVWFGTLFFNRGSLAEVNESALHAEQRGELQFAHVRLWGSVSFIIVGYLAGWAVQLAGLTVLPPLGVAFLLLVVLSTWQTKTKNQERFNRALLLPHRLPGAASMFLISTALLWASHGPLYNYLSLHLEGHGWLPSEISLAWAVGVAAEVAVFLLFPKIVASFSLVQFMRISLAFTTVRWLVLWFAESHGVIILSSVLHGLSFGATYLGSMRLIRDYMGERPGAQAVLLAYGFGAGALLGKLLSGWGASVLELRHDFAPLFPFAAVFALAALLTFELGERLRGRGEDGGSA